MTVDFQHPSQFPFSRPFGSEPPREYAEYRETGCPQKVKLYNGASCWLATTHHDVCEVLDNSSMSHERSNPGFPELHEGGQKAKEGKATFVDMDDPDHARQRSWVQDMFNRDHVEQMRPDMQQTADMLIDRMVSQTQPVDFVEVFARQYPTRLVYKLLGIPEKDIEELTSYSEVRSSGSGTARDASGVNEKLRSYMDHLVDIKEKKPEDDLVSKLVVEHMKPGHMSRDDVAQIAFLVIVAGNATMINYLSLGLVTLLEHPKQLHHCKKSPKFWPAAVEELLRFHTASALSTRRVAKEDVTIGGKAIKKGDGVIASNAAGNRDGNVFPEPDVFDVHRRRGDEPGLGFGWGPHMCIAADLSKVELEVAFERIFTRLPDIKLATKSDELEYTAPQLDVGIVELPVYFER